MTDEAADRRPPTGAANQPDGSDGIDRDRTAELPAPPGAPAPASSPPPAPPTGQAGASDPREHSPEPDPHQYAPGPPDPGGYASDAGHHGYAPGPPDPEYATSGGPPPGGTPFTSRYGLVRPRQGRYLAGVCAAIGRATNTDPILWRVLLAVLGFFGGIGIVVYLAAWLIIPAEGDTASPVESMLGRGRSSMSPILVIILGVLVAVLFGYIVTDAFRAVLLGAAILIGGALLLNRDAPAATGRPAPFPPAGAGGTDGAGEAGAPGPMHPAAGPVPAWAASAADPAAGYPVASGAVPSAAPTHPDPAPAYPSWYHPAATTPGMPFGTQAQPTGGYPAGPSPYPPGGPYPAERPAPAGPLAAHGGPLPGSSPLNPPPVPAGNWPVPPAAGAAVPPPKAGYRPAFAPHGPYAQTGSHPPAPPVRTQKRPKPPKPPRERSPLGAATFSMIFVAIGVVAIIDLVDAVAVRPSTYFAAVLITIALGLLVGVWFGRARWLIVLGLVASAALGISTLAESYDAENAGSPVLWRPANHDALAVRYQATFGDATLDLRQVDFTGHDTPIEVRVDFGTLRVLVPPTVDTTVVTEVNAGDARVFDSRWSGVGGGPQEATDLGPDGVGGGALRLFLHVKAGDAEVSR